MMNEKIIIQVLSVSMWYLSFVFICFFNSGNTVPTFIARHSVVAEKFAVFANLPHNTASNPYGKCYVRFLLS